MRFRFVVNSLCVLESIGLEISENAIQALWVLDNLKQCSYQSPQMKAVTVVHTS